MRFLRFGLGLPTENCLIKCWCFLPNKRKMMLQCIPSIIWVRSLRPLDFKLLSIVRPKQAELLRLLASLDSLSFRSWLHSSLIYFPKETFLFLFAKILASTIKYTLQVLQEVILAVQKSINYSCNLLWFFDLSIFFLSLIKWLNCEPAAWFS